ncbi:hypothetical protein LAD77_02210 [Klebsiella pneumoniae]|nr:hypothetical protein [Klebsiella pneumoniae]
MKATRQNLKRLAELLTGKNGLDKIRLDTDDATPSNSSQRIKKKRGRRAAQLIGKMHAQRMSMPIRHAWTS